MEIWKKEFIFWIWRARQLKKIWHYKIALRNCLMIRQLADVTGLSNLRMDPCMMLFMKEDLVFCLYPGGIISYLISVKTEIRIGTYKKHSFHFTKNHVAWCRKGKNSFVGRMYRLISDSAQTRCYLFMGFWGNMNIAVMQNRNFPLHLIRSTFDRHFMSE